MTSVLCLKLFLNCCILIFSFLSDTLQIFFNNSVKLLLNNTNIAWSTDRSRKFKNPVHVNGDLAGGKPITDFEIRVTCTVWTHLHIRLASFPFLVLFP